MIDLRGTLHVNALAKAVQLESEAIQVRSKTHMASCSGSTLVWGTS